MEREKVVEEELPPEERGLPPEARRRRRWLPWAVLAIVAVVIIAAVAAWQLGFFKGNQAPIVTGVSEDLRVSNVGQTINFTASASDPDGSIVSYAWDFGDGKNATTTTPTASHSYALPGNFIVLLTVRDNGGATTTNDGNLTYVVVKIRDVRTPTAPPPTGKAPPIAQAAVDNNNPGVNQRVNFNGTFSHQWVWVWHSATSGSWVVSNKDVGTYTWNFGDGSATVQGNEATAGLTNHSYGRVGNWFTNLTVQNSNGTSDYGITVRAAPTSTGVRNPSTFNSVSFGDPQFLDPAVDYETAGGEVLQNVYETALWYVGSSTTNLTGLLATQVPSTSNGGISPDGTTYSFLIRANVKFHNDDPLTLTDVAYSWQRPFIIHDPDGPFWMMDLALFNYLFSSYINSCDAGGMNAGASPANTNPCLAQTYLGDLQAALGKTPPQWITAAFAGHRFIDEPTLRAVLDAAIFANTTAGTPAGTTGVVTIRLVRPYPALLKIAAFTVMDVVDKKVVDAHGGDKFGKHNDWMDHNALGTGPFKFRAWQPNQVIILDRWDGYWRTPARLKQVNLLKVTDITTRELMLFSGQADLAAITRNHQLDVMNASGTPRPGLAIDKDQPGFTVGFIGLNQRYDVNGSLDSGFTNIPSTFFGDIHVRKAFSYAFDYNTFINNVLFGGATRLHGPIPQGMFGFTAQPKLFGYDPAAAAAELRLAADTRPGAPAGSNYCTNGFHLSLYYNAGNLNREQEALLLQKGLAATGCSNIQVQVIALQWPVFLENQQHKRLPIFFLGWAPDYADPDDYVTPFLDSTAGTFAIRTHYKNATIDDLIHSAASEVDQAKRAQAYATMQIGTYQDDVPYVWVSQATSFNVMKSWVKGWVDNPMYTNYGNGYYYDLSKG